MAAPKPVSKSRVSVCRWKPNCLAARISSMASAKVAVCSELDNADSILQAAPLAPEPTASATAIPAVEPTEPTAAPMAVESVTAELDQSGLTDSRRAVNDPRVEPMPIGEVSVETLRQALFLEQEAPPVSIVSRDIPRASNDPRGPKAGLSFAAAKPSTEELSDDESLPDAQAN